jgi:hypothetical protein
MKSRQNHIQVRLDGTGTGRFNLPRQFPSPLVAILAVDGINDKLASLSKSLDLGQGFALWVVWPLAVLCIGVAFCLIVGAFQAVGRVRRQARVLSESKYHLEFPCQFCNAPLLVSKSRRNDEITCSNCNQTKPARKDPIRLFRKFLRWLLSPSFQDLL